MPLHRSRLFQLQHSRDRRRYSSPVVGFLFKPAPASARPGVKLGATSELTGSPLGDNQASQFEFMERWVQAHPNGEIATWIAMTSTSSHTIRT